MKQLLSFVLTILLWIVAIVLWATQVTPWLFLGLLILHSAELILIGYRTGRKAGKSPLYSILMGITFGYPWWLPLYRAMAAEDFTDADFIEDGLEPWREKVEA